MKLTAIRANVEWSNVSSVSNYYSDNAGFVALSSKTSSRHEGFTNLFGSTGNTSVFTENADGTVSLQTRQSSQSNINNFGGKTTFENSYRSEGNFVSTTETSSGKAFSSTQFGQNTASRSFKRSSKSLRFAHSGETTQGTTGKSSSSYSTAGDTYGSQTGVTVRASASFTASRRTTQTIDFNSTISATTKKSNRVGGVSRTERFLTTVDDVRQVSQTNGVTPNNDVENETPAATTLTIEEHRLRKRTSYTGSYTTYSYEAVVPSTEASESTVTLTNKSLFESTFTYTQNVTTWTTYSSKTVTSFMPDQSGESFYDTAETTQQAVTSLYASGGVLGWVPLESCTGWTSTQFNATDLTSSISIYFDYLPNRTAHTDSIEAASNDNENLTWHNLSQLYEEEEGETSESITFTYSTSDLTNIVETDSTITGNFSFGKTTEISTAYSTTSDSYYDYTNLSTGTRISYVQTFITDSVDGVVTTTAADFCRDTTATSTYYEYSSELSSETKQTFADTSARDIGFFKAGFNGSYSTTYINFDREFFPFFSVISPLGGFSHSMISRKWGGLNGFQQRLESTRTDAIKGIPEISFTDQYITTFSSDVEDVSDRPTTVDVTTSFGTTTTDTTDSYFTTTTFTSNVDGNKIETTEYSMPLYDTSYKLNRYYTYIQTSEDAKYVADSSSFLSTDNRLSVTNTRSQIFKLETEVSAPSFSYSSELFGVRELSTFGEVTTREIPGFTSLSTYPRLGEAFVDTEGTLFITCMPHDRDFDPSIFTGTASTDYITFDFSESNVISSSMPKHKILRLKNTHGLLKQRPGMDYPDGEFGSSPLGERIYFGGEQYPYPSPYR